MGVPSEKINRSIMDAIDELEYALSHLSSREDPREGLVKEALAKLKEANNES